MRAADRKGAYFFLPFSLSSTFSAPLIQLWRSRVTDLQTPIKTCQICVSKVERGSCHAVGLHSGDSLEIFIKR